MEIIRKLEEAILDALEKDEAIEEEIAARRSVWRKKHVNVYCEI